MLVINTIRYYYMENVSVKQELKNSTLINSTWQDM